MGSLDEFAKLVVNGNVYGIDVQAIEGGDVAVSDKLVTRRGPLAEWQAALLAALSEKAEPSYPQLMDWILAQRVGSTYLVVLSDDKEIPCIPKPIEISRVVTVIREELITSDDVSVQGFMNYGAVWLSRQVSIECEALIPRGVKVYRER